MLCGSLLGLHQYHHCPQALRLSFVPTEAVQRPRVKCTGQSELHYCLVRVRSARALFQTSPCHLAAARLASSPSTRASLERKPSPSPTWRLASPFESGETTAPRSSCSRNPCLPRHAGSLQSTSRAPCRTSSRCA